MLKQLPKPVRAVIIVIGIHLFLYLVIIYYLSNRILVSNSSFDLTLNDINNYWGTTYEEMIGLLPPAEDHWVTGYEDVLLNTKYFNVSDSASCVFIFAHGWARGWQDMLKYYPLVEDCGCNIVMYDHRAHGESGGEYPTGGIKEGKDLLAVSKWVGHEKGFEMDQIAWLGSSWGAAAALMAGAENQNPAFIIADSPFQNWFSAVFERAIVEYGSGVEFLAPGVMTLVDIRADVKHETASAVEATKKIDEPVLLIHSKADPETNPQQSINISENLNSSSEFHLTDWGNIHVMDVINNLDEMKDILHEFIQKNELQAFMK